MNSPVLHHIMLCLLRLNGGLMGFLLFNKLALCINSIMHCRFLIENVLLVHDFKILLDARDITLTFVNDNFSGNLLLTFFVGLPLQAFKPLDVLARQLSGFQWLALVKVHSHINRVDRIRCFKDLLQILLLLFSLPRMLSLELLLFFRNFDHVIEIHCFLLKLFLFWGD